MMAAVRDTSSDLTGMKPNAYGVQDLSNGLLKLFQAIQPWKCCWLAFHLPDQLHSTAPPHQHCLDAIYVGLSPVKLVTLLWWRYCSVSHWLCQLPLVYLFMSLIQPNYHWKFTTRKRAEVDVSKWTKEGIIYTLNNTTDFTTSIVPKGLKPSSQ